MQAFGLAVRFLLEVVGVAALAYSGYQMPSATPAKVAVALAAPLALILVWAFVVAPGADNPLSQTTRMLIGSVLLLLPAGALAAAGRTVLGIVVAVVVVLDTALLLSVGDRAG